MSEQIDWSKAPEWATHALEKLHEPDINIVYWSFFVDGEHRVEPGGLWYHPDGYRVMQSRPTTPSWSGEGLPPVGVVCEDDAGNQVVIVAHHINGTHAIFAESIDHGLLYYGAAGDFRTIRTLEQIAADEREAAIKEIESLICGDYYSGVDTARIIYDAGYRKP